MLVELKIENIGIIEEICLRSGAGLNVITGETGSGKSLVLHSLDAVLGSRAASGLVRKGSARGIVQATFDCSGNPLMRQWLEKNGFPSDDPYLILKREISSEGKSRASINGISATISLLRSCASGLLEIHGQHEHQRLFDPDIHLEFLDIFAGSLEQRNRISELYHKYTGMKNRLKAVTLEAGEKEQRLDFLRFALDEIETFEPSEDEFEHLSQERAMIQNSGKFFCDLNIIYGILRGEDGSILDRITSIENLLEEHSPVFRELEEKVTEIREAEYRLEAVADFIREQKDKMHYSPERLEDIEDRLSGYRRLHKKYGGSTASVLTARDGYLRELTSIEMSDEEAELLISEIEIVYSEMKDLSEELSRKRRSIAHVLEEKLSHELSNLGMPGASIHIAINREMERGVDLRQNGGENRKYVINEKGLDRVEFLLRANIGEAIQPLRKVASGGELSRIMLALKSVIIAGQPAGSVVFDEIDSGVGGEIANTIGERLKILAMQGQVIVVTHLHQIASLADHHFKLFKETNAGRTTSRLQKLQGEIRLREMARMLGGESSGPMVMEHARELLSRSA